MLRSCCYASGSIAHGLVHTRTGARVPASISYIRVSLVGRRGPRCRTGHTAIMSGGRAANARAHEVHSGWHRGESGTRTRSTRFAGVAFTQNDRLAVRTPGPIRTADLPLRRRVRFRCATRVWCAPLVPTQVCVTAAGLQPAGRAAVHDALGVSARGRSGTARVTTWCAQPVHHTHRGTRGRNRTCIRQFVGLELEPVRATRA